MAACARYPELKSGHHVVPAILVPIAFSAGFIVYDTSHSNTSQGSVEHTADSLETKSADEESHNKKLQFEPWSRTLLKLGLHVYHVRATCGQLFSIANNNYDIVSTFATETAMTLIACIRLDKKNLLPGWFLATA